MLNFKTMLFQKNKNGKVIAVASIGGHWVQLLRIAKPLQKYKNIVYISTNEKCRQMLDANAQLYIISEFSRWDLWKIIPCLIEVLKVLIKEKPDAVISTGAAPGLITVFVAKLLFIKTIWVDSIANVEKLSFSGRIASYLVNQIYVQWPDLANERLKFSGNILGEL